MSEKIVNGDFESAAPPPDATGSSVVTTGPPSRSGTRIGIVSGSGGFPGVAGSLEWTNANGGVLALNVGAEHVVSVWLWGEHTGAQDVTVWLDDGSGSLSLWQTITPVVENAWRFYTYTFTATGTAGRLHLRGTMPVGPLWLFDDLSIDSLPVSAVPKAKHLARNALISALDTIDGAPDFYHSLAGRVFKRLVTPIEEPQVLEVGAYLCVPVLDVQAFPEQSRDHVRISFPQTIFGFVPDLKEEDPLDAAVADLADKMHDDIVKALLSDPKLGGTLNVELEFASAREWAGETIDSPYGEVQVTVTLDMYLQRSDLGPA